MYPLHDLWLSSWRQIVVPKVIFSLHQMEENINLREKKNSFEVFMAFLSPPPHFRAELFTYLDFFLSSLQPFRICKHWTRSLFPQLTTTNRLHVYWWNRWNRQIWIFPSIPNTDTMYINSGAIHVHSATGVLTVRGDKQLSLRGGGYIRGESIDTSPGLRGGRGKKNNCVEWKRHIIHRVT